MTNTRYGTNRMEMAKNRAPNPLSTLPEPLEHRITALPFRSQPAFQAAAGFLERSSFPDSSLTPILGSPFGVVFTVSSFDSHSQSQFSLFLQQEPSRRQAGCLCSCPILPRPSPQTSSSYPQWLASCSAHSRSTPLTVTC